MISRYAMTFYMKRVDVGLFEVPARRARRATPHTQQTGRPASQRDAVQRAMKCSMSAWPARRGRHDAGHSHRWPWA